MKLRWRRLVFLGLVGAWAAAAVWQANKPLPQGTHVASPVCPLPADQVAFVADITAADAYGHMAVSQGIFDEVLGVVRGARQFIVLDYALIGAAGEGISPQRRLAAELTDALLAQRRLQPDLKVLFITDPAHEHYGSTPDPQLQLLRAAGVQVVRADLDALRDPNFLYSSLWRLTLRWWDGPTGPLGVQLRRLNFKADHRKVVIADDGRAGVVAVVGSANPLDQQSAWSNVAARVSGDTVRSLLASELAIALFSGWSGPSETFMRAAEARATSACTPAAQQSVAALPPGADVVQVQALTEGAIRTALLAQIGASGRGDAIDLALFAFADRGVTEALLDAARRGVAVRLILDPSEDATTLAPSGLPNQPVASELVSRSGGTIHVRWYRTHGERFHDALAMVYGPQRLWLAVGSANLTRRSLDDYNLEADLALGLARDAPLAQQSLDYFDTLWSNRASLGIEYTADFAAFADPGQAHYWLCRLLEGAGLAAF